MVYSRHGQGAETRAADLLLKQLARLSEHLSDVFTESKLHFTNLRAALGNLDSPTNQSLNPTKDDLFICRDIALTDDLAANLALQCRLKTV